MPTDSQQIADYFRRDQFAKQNGMEVIEVRPGFSQAEMTVEPRHMNAVGIMQGGAVFTLADLAFALACNSYGVLAVACQVDITYFKAVTGGRLTAVAEEISRTKKLSTCLIRVVHERDGLVALFKGIAYIKGTPLFDSAGS